MDPRSPNPLQTPQRRLKLPTLLPPLVPHPHLDPPHNFHHNNKPSQSLHKRRCECQVNMHPLPPTPVPSIPSPLTHLPRYPPRLSHDLETRFNSIEQIMQRTEKRRELRSAAVRARGVLRLPRAVVRRATVTHQSGLPAMNWSRIWRAGRRVPRM